ncbi:MAG TPA: replication-associated recombination protein A [Limnochordales bacterium]|nr:MAG: AAA family ATPase [Bacillota bacterium]HLT57755.1 replication-associated recombination protein A [Limnochordales bacterium]
MDLFAAAEERAREAHAPLAARMRPRDLDEVVGQEELVGPGGPLRALVESDRLRSMILYGPPGSGKTTLARLIAARTRAAFASLNAVTAGVADVRKVLAEARERLRYHGRRTVLFIDEIHRFNKAQQDALLPAVEDGTVVLIGATTQNPYFSVNAPLLSRAPIFRLQALTDQHLSQIIDRALADAERGLGALAVELEPGARALLLRAANGDARAALNGLELAVQIAQGAAGEEGADGTRPGPIRITAELVAAALQTRTVAWDGDGDAHYDTMSAFIKSMRGSDPDAAVYWLARLLEAGEDPRTIARRLIIHAAEDVGNADPQALLVAVAAAQAVEHVGLPEGRIPLAQATLYIATAPKSNAAYKAIGAALEAVRTERWEPVPVHLRDASYPGAQRLGHGKGYLYPHDYPGHHVPQVYLPANLVGRRFYAPSDQGYEAVLAERLRRWREGRPGPEDPAS